MRFMGILGYLFTYLQVVNADYVPQLGGTISQRVMVFNIFILGFILETVEDVAIRFRGNVAKCVGVSAGRHGRRWRPARVRWAWLLGWVCHADGAATCLCACAMGVGAA